MRYFVGSALGLLILIAGSGCEDLFEGSSGESDRMLSHLVGEDPVEDNQAGQTAETGETAVADSGEAAASDSVPADLSGVVWLHTDVSGWAQTASLNASVSGGQIVLKYDKAKVWPGVSAGGTICNANPWVFVHRNGKWYAATFEWLRPGQTSKPVSTVNGDHIKKSPLENFNPVSGEVYGFMVSGLARDKTRNVRERSNVDMVRWP